VITPSPPSPVDTANSFQTLKGADASAVDTSSGPATDASTREWAASVLKDVDEQKQAHNEALQVMSQKLSVTEGRNAALRLELESTKDQLNVRCPSVASRTFICAPSVHISLDTFLVTHLCLHAYMDNTV
jgi:hypothetical protein